MSDCWQKKASLYWAFCRDPISKVNFYIVWSSDIWTCKDIDPADHGGEVSFSNKQPEVIDKWAGISYIARNGNYFSRVDSSFMVEQYLWRYENDTVDVIDVPSCVPSTPRPSSKIRSRRAFVNDGSSRMHESIHPSRLICNQVPRRYNVSRSLSCFITSTQLKRMPMCRWRCRFWRECISYSGANPVYQLVLVSIRSLIN